MNRTILRALLTDALYQVLDDKVFRLLVILSIGLIAPTFLVGFKPEGISLLFGWKTFTYVDLLGSVGTSIPRGGDVQIAVIAWIQHFIVDQLAGNVGMLFCIAATAFFVPRMLEKGAADTLFSKPTSRYMLLLARYASGVLFVGVLAFTLVLGMHLGFRIMSGHADPAFLWSALTLVYVFALIHAVSVAVAVFTRSSVAAILCTLMLFVFNGCVQQGWVFTQHASEVRRLDPDDDEAERKVRPAVIEMLIGALDVAHWILPKTHDADVIVKQLRIAVTGDVEVLRDPEAHVIVMSDPEAMKRDLDARVVDLESRPAVWLSVSGREDDGARIELARKSRLTGATDSRGRPRRQSASIAAFELAKGLEKSPETSGKPAREHRNSTAGLGVEWVRWGEKHADKRVEMRRGFMAVDDEMIVLDGSIRADGTRLVEFDQRLESFAAGIRVDQQNAKFMQPDDWYEKVFGWRSESKFNTFVSIGTSLMFAFVLLGLACWRLARIDF